MQYVKHSSRATCHVNMFRATQYERTAQLLNMTEFKSHLFELYFIGWTTNQWRRGGSQSTRRKPLMTSFRKISKDVAWEEVLVWWAKIHTWSSMYRVWIRSSKQTTKKCAHVISSMTMTLCCPKKWALVATNGKPIKQANKNNCSIIHIRHADTRLPCGGVCLLVA